MITASYFLPLLISLAMNFSQSSTIQRTGLSESPEDSALFEKMESGIRKSIKNIIIFLIIFIIGLLIGMFIIKYSEHRKAEKEANVAVMEEITTIYIINLYRIEYIFCLVKCFKAVLKNLMT